MFLFSRYKIDFYSTIRIVWASQAHFLFIDFKFIKICVDLALKSFSIHPNIASLFVVEVYGPVNNVVMSIRCQLFKALLSNEAIKRSTH